MNNHIAAPFLGHIISLKHLPWDGVTRNLEVDKCGICVQTKKNSNQKERMLETFNSLKSKALLKVEAEVSQSGPYPKPYLRVIKMDHEI